MSDFLFDLPEPGPGLLTTACRQTLEALHTQGLLEARHTASAALVLSLSAAMDSVGAGGGATRRGTPLALLARELREALAALPEPAGQVDGAWSELEEALRRAAVARDTP